MASKWHVMMSVKGPASQSGLPSTVYISLYRYMLHVDAAVNEDGCQAW